MTTERAMSDQSDIAIARRVVLTTLTRRAIITSVSNTAGTIR